MILPSPTLPAQGGTDLHIPRTPRGLSSPGRVSADLGANAVMLALVALI